MFGLNFNISSDYFVTLRTETMKSTSTAITQSHTQSHQLNGSGHTNLVPRDTQSMALGTRLETIDLHVEIRINRLGFHQYARLGFLPQRSRGPQQLEGDNTSGEVASSSQETGTTAEYENLTSEGEPVPGLSNKLGNLPQGDATGSGVEGTNNTYSTMERPAEVILPIESENASTTKDV